MSQVEPCGRRTPRWSRWRHVAASPALRAGLPGRSAMVGVGPPFAWSSPRCAGWSRTFPEPLTVQPVVSSIKLFVAVMVPPQFVCDDGVARRLSTSGASPVMLNDPLFARVELTIVPVPVLPWIPPPPPVLPSMVEFRTVTSTFGEIAPPPPAVFPDRVEPTTVSSPYARKAPPLLSASLFRIRLFWTRSDSWNDTAP